MLQNITYIANKTCYDTVGAWGGCRRRGRPTGTWRWQQKERTADWDLAVATEGEDGRLGPGGGNRRRGRPTGTWRWQQKERTADWDLAVATEGEDGRLAPSARNRNQLELKPKKLRKCFPELVPKGIGETKSK